MKFAAIIFDMDGLLVDSEPVWEMAEQAVIEAHGNTYDDEFRNALIGLRMDEFVAGLRKYFQFEISNEEIYQEIIDKMLDFIPIHVKAQTGANELIQYVKEQDVTRAIASSSPQSIIDRTVTSKGWEDAFPRRYTADLVDKGKPAPDVYLYTAEKLGVKPENCLALEDSPNGARAAVSAGMTCYAIPDPSHSKKEAFADITPHVFDSLLDVLAELQGQNHS